MLRAKQLGAVVFNNPNTLFIQEQYANDDILGKVYMSAASTHIVYESTIETPYITLDSKQYGIITEAQRSALETMWEALDTTYTLTYDNSATETVRMAHEKKMIFTELWEGACSFRVILPLAKVSS